MSVDEDDQVHLQTRAFIPQRGLEEKIAYFRHNLHDHACAAVHNLTDAGEPFFERSVHYDSLSQAGVQQLRDAVRTDGMQLLLTLNQLAAELEEREQPPAEVRQRITVGLYFYAEPSPPEAASATKASKP